MLKKRIKLFIARVRAERVAIMICAGILAFLLLVTVRVEDAPVQGLALAYSVQYSEVGNIPKLSVVLPDGLVVQVTIPSIGKVKLDESVCLMQSKTLIYFYRYRFKNVGECT